MNWIVRLFVYFGIATISGPYFDNWTTTEKYLFLSDAYADVCSKVERAGPPKNTYRCEKQRLKVSDLLSYGRMPEFLTSVFIGIVIDCHGPRIVCFTGVIMALISWILLGYFPNYDATLKISMILMGTCTNATLLPALTIERYTKRYKAQAVVYMGMSSSFTCFIIKGMERLLYHGIMGHRALVLCFILTLIIPSLISSIFVYPNGVLSDAEQMEEDKNLTFTENGSGYPKVMEGNSIPEENGNGQIDALSVRTDCALDDIESCKYQNELPLPSPREIWNFYGFLRSLKSKNVMLCTIYYALNIVSITYSQQALTMSYSKNALVLEVTEYLIPLSFVVCIIFMVVYKFVRPVTVLVIMAILFLLMHISSLCYGTGWGIAFAIFLSCIYSIYNTQVYVYLESRVSKAYYSSIIGFLNTVGGLSVFINMGLLHYIQNSENIQKVYAVLLAIRLVFLTIFTVMMLDPILHISNKFTKIQQTL